MALSILHPELMTIADPENGQSYLGGFQDWYSTAWSRDAGCGPVSAANVLAYLALTRPELRGLYGYEAMDRASFARHMEEVYEFVTPGGMGLNRVEMYTRGVVDFARSRGIALAAHAFSAPGNMTRNRPASAELAEFVKAGLEADCPLGFLNLSRGQVKNIQGWHWITVFAASLEDGGAIARASDEGKEISFDLRLWYLTTRMQGGLAYFTES